RRGVWGWVQCALINLRGVWDAFRMVRQLRPRVIVGFGGYVSFPLMIAGVCVRTPVVVHEANAVAGKTVRLLVRLGAWLAYGLESCHEDFRHARVLRLHPERVRMTGNPIRRQFWADLAAPLQPLPHLTEGVQTVLVTGGSQGARRLNQVVPDALAQLRGEGRQVQVIHVTGEGGEADVRERYQRAGVPAFVVAFYERMGVLYRWADVVVARAGALTVSEICARGVASMLVPYPHATDDHQQANAAVLAERGGAVVVEDSELDVAVLVRTLRELLSDSARRGAMGARARAQAVPDAAERLIKFVEECVERRR
ncbi:MAG: UDP-N-acetylglucosamine--N-acetylmuramyl-(pentapeptide) pyrophosphoryl-undecaprenol N-acetylglucosamine transferase, partial [bacterium]|nr:UDP-N-acetylglucosamine--N-acetylmuramyl-(pentapeptide) pyrophosphoryl-undecaprenol N-acetylglucosamine transferase [bacterium]